MNFDSVCVPISFQGLYEQSHPRVAKIILKFNCMDNSMASDDEEGKLYKELFDLWGKVGMKTHKWLSNLTKVLELFHHRIQLLR